MWLRKIRCSAVATVFGIVAATLSMQGCAPGPDAKPKIDIVYVNWAEGIAMTNLAKAILEDKMDYEVRLQLADVAPVYTALAQGDADVFVDAWLPTLHADYMLRFGDRIEDLGHSYEGTQIGLVVPEHVAINSIAELNDHAGRFRNQIIGIDSGAGIMTKTEEAIEEYGLNLRLVPSSGPAMTAALMHAVDSGEWVVVTGWRPHWKFGRWDLKVLDDPKGVYGEPENIHKLARDGFSLEDPVAAAFFRSFQLSDDYLADLMDAINLSEDDPETAAREWMHANEALVDSWIPHVAKVEPTL